jgi:hypothetical protein
MIVSEKSTRPLDYYKSREYFINDKIDRLSVIIFLIEGQFSSTLLRKLKLIKDHRNYIAHGKRDVAPPAVELNLEEIALVLDKVIGEIES